MQMGVCEWTSSRWKREGELFCARLMIARLQETVRTTMSCRPQAQGPILSLNTEINYGAEHGGKITLQSWRGHTAAGQTERGTDRWRWLGFSLSVVLSNMWFWGRGVEYINTAVNRVFKDALKGKWAFPFHPFQIRQSHRSWRRGKERDERERKIEKYRGGVNGRHVSSSINLMNWKIPECKHYRHQNRIERN